MDKIEKHCRDILSTNVTYTLSNEIRKQIEGILNFLFKKKKKNFD